MSKKSKRISTIILGTLIGAFLSAVGCATVWYEIGYRYPYSGFFGREGSVIDGAIGLVFGTIGGAIIGSVITGFRLRKLVSIFVGLLVNGMVPLLVFYGSGGSNPPHDVERTWNYSSVGQALVGGAVGLLIAIFSNYMNPIPSEDLQ